MTAPSRVLLLEDDASIRRFVGMALAELPIELVEARSISEAWEQLGRQDVDLFISDLMLPDGNAMDMFHALREQPLGHTLPVVIFSAGVSAATREVAAELGVFRVLDKPVPYRELVACVEQAIGGTGHPPPAGAGGLADSLPATQRQRAIDDHFGGQAALFDEFLASCLAQLPADIAAGDQACASQDAGALRRVAHNLKSVLQLIGSTEGHAMARGLEHAAAEGQGFAAMTADWDRVRALVASLHRPAA
jgi:CheY-like chemotaxis protein/HPt (histidine-containing phosphotransfer) domain-containing protein